ncbi:DUF167 family protein [Afifella sp. IM 167]|uniref:DUF167 family protein n=1 Tax=Afifella sp. IM 167 TaxID=2033586 RepID=UPI001CCF93D6|nr:DUF167 family protein [Afifella sp. IM 167]MBZ8132768.1 hypothetical protein [Afifella sp. IM 167]
MSAARPWRPSPEGLTLTVRLTPKAARDAVEGIEELADGTAVLKARVRAVPEKGAANKALQALLAKSLGLPKSAVAVTAGATSRVKTLSLAGEAEEIEKRLETFRA